MQDHIFFFNRNGNLLTTEEARKEKEGNFLFDYKSLEEPKSPLNIVQDIEITPEELAWASVLGSEPEVVFEPEE